MQDYIHFAEKNGIILEDSGFCQFCGAKTERGIHECLEIFNFGFSGVDYAKPENLEFKFLVVDSHTLQHPEIHGRWNNHFHLTRMTLVLKEKISWTYELSPILSNTLKEYKITHPSEVLTPPKIGHRGKITTSDVLLAQENSLECKNLIRKWAEEVFLSWQEHHHTVDSIAQSFLSNRKQHITY